MIYDLDELDRLHAAATPGKAEAFADNVGIARVLVDGCPLLKISESNNEDADLADAQHLAALHNAYPALAAEIRALRAAIDAMTVMSRGDICYRTANGVAMDMPERVRKAVRKALKGDA